MKLYAFFILLLLVAGAQAQTTAFNYQGSLSTGGLPANGSFDMEFALFDAVAGGGQLGSTITLNGITVTDGIFSASLDFGDQFPGAARFLEIRVRQTGGGGFTTLTPRQPVTSTPYAIKSVTADDASTAALADNALQLGGVAANQYVVTTDPRMTDARDPLAGSNNYIRNSGLLQQAAASFWISGSGNFGGGGNFDGGLSVGGNMLAAGTLSGGIVNAATQYNIGGTRFLSVGGEENTFAGVGAGSSTTGAGNSFFGRDAGLSNTTGHSNSFYGRSAGRSNSIGRFNSFFGSEAGFSNTSGVRNSFFGLAAGKETTSGESNSFFGSVAGENNTTGNFNTFIGRGAGTPNNTGSSNSFFGESAGTTQTTGSNNTLIGRLTDVATGSLSFATAIGAGAVVTSSNRIQIGRSGLDAVRLGLLAGPSATQLCIITATNTIAGCTSSARYKENIKPFAGGLNLVNRLNPVTYDWIEQKEPDLGLIAEEVAETEPLLVTYNQKGEIQGVKYDQITLALINAVKEQQQVIERQNARIAALMKLVCASNKDADVCK